jgi:hypothetical protein
MLALLKIMFTGVNLNLFKTHDRESYERLFSCDVC